ncbi:MAG TPA: hypothetical protein VFH82_08075 [Gemmatimonadota bacterium]|jgi:hypothetical protein|nr:hypothetical protein [Gemmatimonadota bacterium]
MRFTWIALPVLLVTLTGTSGASPPPADESSDRERVVERATTSTATPVVALPSTRVSDWKRLGAEEQERRDSHPDAAAPPGSRRATQARVRIRTVDLAGTAFIPEITRATTGFLSSSTTACPPPANR